MEDGVNDDPEPWNRMKDLENSNDTKNHQEIQSIFVAGLALLSGMMSYIKFNRLSIRICFEKPEFCPNCNV